MKLPFLSEVLAGSMWRAMGWACGPWAKCGLDNTERRMEHPKKKGARMLMTREISSRAHNLLSVKHATAHRKRIGDKKKQKQERSRTSGGSCYSILTTRTEGPTVQLCGDSNVARKWINLHCAISQKYKENKSYAENIALVVGEKGCKSTSPRMTIK